jgi:hypothetical protein
VRGNVPFDVAFGGEEIRRRIAGSREIKTALAIMMQEFEGREFDIDRFQWKESK